MTAAATDELGKLLSLEESAQDLLFRSARTANAFTDEPVTDDQVRAIYDLVKWGPTSMNQQPLRVLLVRSLEGRERLLPHMAEGNRAKTGSAPLTAILAADIDFHENLPRVFPRQHARTQRFTLGAPRAFTVAPDGSRVMFLRSASGTDPRNRLWSLATGTGEETCVADPGALFTGDEDLPPEERALRERRRESAAGVVDYATHSVVRIAAFTPSRPLFVAHLGGGRGPEPGTPS